MSSDALQRLEQLRRDDVERAQRELAEGRRQRDEARAAHQTAELARGRAEAALLAAQRGFATAGTVFALRAAELHLVALRGTLGRATARCAHTAQRAHLTDQVLLKGEGRLRALELARRAVARTLEQRAAHVNLRTERLREDASDDAFRTQALLSERTSAARARRE